MSIVTADIWSGIEAVITSTTGNRVAVLSGPRVRIPPTPPQKAPKTYVFGAFTILFKLVKIPYNRSA